MAGRINHEYGENEQGRSLPPRSSEPSNQLGEKPITRENSRTGVVRETQRGLSQTEPRMDRRAGQGVGRENLTPVINGTHTGKIILVDEKTIVQQKLNGTLVHHDTQKLPNITPKDVGSSVKITYHKDGASVEPAGKNNQKTTEKDKELGNNGKSFGLDND